MSPPDRPLSCRRGEREGDAGGSAAVFAKGEGIGIGPLLAAALEPPGRGRSSLGLLAAMQPA